jgi:hypothetical protein
MFRPPYSVPEIRGEMEITFDKGFVLRALPLEFCQCLADGCAQVKGRYWKGISRN